MMQHIDKDAQNESRTVLSASEDLRPIHIGVVAQQPGPDTKDVVYVGLTSLLPDGLRVLCSCAGLFFARVLQVGEDRYQVEIAALSHYFDAPARMRECHVRTMVLSAVDFAQLLEWDRSLAGRATCDIREIVEEHDATITRSQQTPVQAAVSAFPTTPTTEQEPVGAAHSHEDADMHQGQTTQPKEKEDADLEILTTVYVERWRIQQIFEEWQIRATADRHQRGPDRRIQSVLLHAALEVEHDPAMSKKIKEVRQWRRQRRTEGYGWQRVVTLAPGADGGGWDLVIGRPAA